MHAFHSNTFNHCVLDITSTCDLTKFYPTIIFNTMHPEIESFPTFRGPPWTSSLTKDYPETRLQSLDTKEIINYLVSLYLLSKMILAEE